MTVFARILLEKQAHFGLVQGETLEVLEGSPFGSHRATGRKVPLKSAKLLAPCTPSKVICIGLNYKSHLDTRPAPEKPEPFFVPASALAGPGDEVILPPGATHVEEEAELVVVMGRRCKACSPEQALEYVFGYTCGNDISERNWQKNDKQWWRAKGSDTFSPLGPYIVQGLDPDALTVVARVNGTEVQRGNTSDLLFKVPALVSFVSQSITLEPGDVIYTGTPGKPAQVKSGAVMEVEIEGIGILMNKVR